MARRTRQKKRLYSPADLEEAVNVLLSTMAKGKASDTRVLRVQAAAAMLHSLADKSGGAVIAGCCTQGCCDALALKMIARKR